MSEQASSSPRSEIARYADGATEVFRQPEDTLSATDLGNRLLRPELSSGSIHVVTKDDDGVRRDLFFDESHAVSESTPWLLADMKKFMASSPDSDTITIGKPWNSPFGVTERVVGVAMPYYTGIYDNSHTLDHTDKQTPTGRGAQLIDAAVAAAAGHS
jgi:hypothetical protein